MTKNEEEKLFEVEYNGKGLIHENAPRVAFPEGGEIPYHSGPLGRAFHIQISNALRAQKDLNQKYEIVLRRTQ